MYELKKQAFTLVELIVVITILAILGTIAFISMQSYSAHARDSVRISDIGKMKTSLELFQLDAGKYPDPTDGFIVTYSGSEVWTQGIFGESSLTNVSKLDKIPTDPLTQKEYTYSVTNTRQEYQFAGIVESDEIGLNSKVSQANAGDLIATALVSGTYNGQIIKTQNGTNCNILSLPSIVSAEPNTVTDLGVILTNQSLVYNGYKNLPTNYITSKYKTDGGFLFTSNKFIVYDDLLSCAPLYNPEDNTARIELITNLQQAYNETIIENEDNISGIVNIDLTDTGALDLISATLINNNLGGKIEIKSSGIIGSNQTPTGGNTKTSNINIDGSITSYISDGPLLNGNNNYSFINGTSAGGDSIVFDDFTGLMWQSEITDNGSYEDWETTKAYCANLNLGGYDDWRLADITELLSIVDYSRNTPSFDNNFFHIEYDDLWSSTTEPSNSEQAKTVLSNNGYVFEKYKYNSRQTACVRGVSSVLPWQGVLSGTYDSNHNRGSSYLADSRFSCLNGTCGSGGFNGVVKDSKTKLYWESEGVTGHLLNWTNSKGYCENLSLGGYDDWRMPSIKEIASISDYTHSNPTIDTNYFTVDMDYSESYYWSSTPDSYYTDMYWIADFYYGYIDLKSSYNTNVEYFIRCVRND